MADEPLVTHAPPPIGAVTVAGGLSKSEVEAIVNNRINSLQQPAPAVDESKIRSIVQAEVQKIPQTPGVNEAKVQELIRSAISQLPPRAVWYNGAAGEHHRTGGYLEATDSEGRAVGTAGKRSYPGRDCSYPRTGEGSF